MTAPKADDQDRMPDSAKEVGAGISDHKPDEEALSEQEFSATKPTVREAAVVAKTLYESGGGNDSQISEKPIIKETTDEPAPSSQKSACNPDFDLDDEDEDPFSGTTIAGKYEMQVKLGGGGAGLVYKAYHKFMKRVVAVKLLFPHMAVRSGVVKRFYKEAEAASALSHPNIIAVYDFGLTETGQPYLVMDFVEGTSLEELVERSGGLPIERSIGIFLQILAGLAHAHEHSVVHRDLKPGNVMLRLPDSGVRETTTVASAGDKSADQSQNYSDHAVIVDFGLAKTLEIEGPQVEKLTQTGEIFGSPCYMSPEQCSGEKLDHRTDLYSFGCLMYETLMGRPPIVGTDPIDTIFKQISGKPDDLSGLICKASLREQLETIVLKTLSKKVETRYQSAREIADDLQAVLSRPQTGLLERLRIKWQRAKIRTMVLRDGTTSRRQILILAVACSIVVGALAAAVYVYFIAPIKPSDMAVTMTWQMSPVPVVVSTEAPDEDLLSDFFLKATIAGEGLKSFAVANQLETKARFLAHSKHLSEAESTYRQLIELRKKISGPESDKLSRAEIGLADCYYEQQKYQQAQPLFEDGISNLAKLIGYRAKELAQPMKRLADIHMASGRYQRAAPYYEAALSAWQEHNQDRSVDFVLAASSLADALRKDGKSKESERWYKTVIAKWENFSGVERQNEALAWLGLADIYAENGNREAELEAVHSALEVLQMTLPGSDKNIGRVLERYSDSLWKSGKWMEALKAKLRARDILLKPDR